MPRIPLAFSVIVAFALVFGGASIVDAQVATPDPASLPEVQAPLGLGDITLPDDAEGIEALFSAPPADVADEPRNPLIHASDRIRVTYGPDDGILGPPLVLSAISFEQGDFFPQSFTAGDYVAMASQTDDAMSTAFGRDGTLVWISAETTIGADGARLGTPEISEPRYTLVWGDIEGEWIFAAAARTPAGLDALVSAFVAAAQGQPATPEAEVTTGHDIGAIHPIVLMRQTGRDARL